MVTQFKPIRKNSRMSEEFDHAEAIRRYGRKHLMTVSIGMDVLYYVYLETHHFSS
jgi:hypothetical protein